MPFDKETKSFKKYERNKKNHMQEIKKDENSFQKRYNDVNE